MAAGARRRQLPAWMGAAGDARAAAAPPEAGRGRRRRRAAAGPRAAAVHCMNEAELVDAALAVLAENLQREENARSGSDGAREPRAAPSEGPGSAAGTAGGSDRSPALPSPPDAGAGADGQRTGWEDSEDDVLKYVREIFFS
ncbi:cell cycle regulator of non-homologous end joining [Opisthocomus hoazin]|uniref:cell cycle regulator of non-homologous end joining n=1 Tax=Opisthocomus hoazin TaxID=30419 RepID=UPI003F53A973